MRPLRKTQPCLFLVPGTAFRKGLLNKPDRGCLNGILPPSYSSTDRIEILDRCTLIPDFICLLQDRTCSAFPLLTPSSVLTSHGSLTQISLARAKEVLSLLKPVYF